MKVIASVKRLLNQIAGLFPTPLPVGMTAFEAWVDSIISTYPMPTTHRDSILNGLAATIMRLGPTDAIKSKAYFALIIWAGAAKQVAGAQFEAIRDKERAAELAAKQKAAKPSVEPIQQP